MIATWLTELSLDRLNRALLEDGEGMEAQSRVEELTEELRAFLKRQVDLLDPRTTINLLASYGRLDDLMHYASYRQVRPFCDSSPQSKPSVPRMIPLAMIWQPESAILELD